MGFDNYWPQQAFDSRNGFYPEESRGCLPWSGSFFCWSKPTKYFTGSLKEEGLELEAEGRYVQALETWATAPEVLEVPSFAIGREYIRLAAEHALREHYETASSLYLWGLGAEEVAPNYQALQAELDMLEPLFSSIAFDKSQYKEWEGLLEDHDPLIYRYLQAFWEELDLTPATRYNERLLEHWERIGHARANFTRDDDPPYGTDDRGPVYVAHGEPDRMESGHLTLNPGDVFSECKSFNPRPSVPSRCNPEVMRNVLMKLDTNPYYEIWIYDKPEPAMQFNLVIIFGQKPLGGFVRVDTIEDLIPNRAFSTGNRFDSPGLITGNNSPGEKITPGMMMQWLYYRQLATTDLFFGTRFNHLNFEWMRLARNDPRVDKHQGPVQEEQSRIITYRNQEKAPPEQSTYEKLFPEIPLQAWHYRMLDPDGRPITTTFLESRPGHVFLNDLAANQDVLFPQDSIPSSQALAHYELEHGVRAIGPEGQLLGQSGQPAQLVLDMQDNTPSSSVFRVPAGEPGQRLVLYAELHNRHPGSKPPVEDTPFPGTLRGLGKLESTPPTPLNSDPATLEMADLVLGYQMRDDQSANVLFPFVVATDKTIPEGEELAVHLEVYHLRPEDPGGLSEARIEYEVYHNRRLQWLRGPDREVSLSFAQQVRGTRLTQNLSIRTRELPPGTYTLRMAVEDPNSGQRKERELEFEVTERAEAELSMSGEE